MAFCGGICANVSLLQGLREFKRLHGQLAPVAAFLTLSVNEPNQVTFPLLQLPILLPEAHYVNLPHKVQIDQPVSLGLHVGDLCA